MKVRNLTNNTMYADDIDFYIPFEEGSEIDLAPDMLKRSRALKSFILNGMLDVIQYDDSEQVESALMYLRNKKLAELRQETQSTKEATISDNSPIIESPKLSTGDQIEVKIHGLFYDDSGYGKVNRNLAIKLHQAGCRVKISPKNSKNQLTSDDLSEIVSLEKTQISKKYIQIDSVIPTFGEIAGGKYRILYTTIESYTIPKQFLDCCELYHEIWVTSPWSASILKKHLDKPIYVIPAGVDENLYREDGQTFMLKPNVKDFVFISVFSWSYRKGYDALLKAYFDEFSADDNVTLLIMSKYQGNVSRYHRNKIKEDIEKIMKEFPNKDLPHLLRHSQVIAEKDMPKMYRAAQCFVLPSRGEGSNLCAVEAAMCGLPVIMTNCSGQQMYLRSDNSYMIEIDQLITVKPGTFHIHYWDGQEFPALTSDKFHSDLKSAMRSVFNNYEEAKRRNRRMQQLILSNFTWTHTANTAIDRLKEIKKKLGD